ncbi:hypothetical protein SAMN02910292_03029 [Lachnospiraceae bacterium XBB2008]|nr:hypothetical protein SAMN02910292_03029 [Lachnospiraceae bacterium XBB2008]
MSEIDSELSEFNEMIKKMINEMDQDSYDLCFSSIHEELGFEVIPKEDIRRIDFIEKIIDSVLYDVYILEILHGEIDAIEYYSSILWFYFFCHIKCAENSRAEQYKLLAEAKIRSIRNEKDKYTSLIDIVMIFLALFREYSQNGYNKEVLIKDIKLRIYREDIDVIEWLYQKGSISTVIGRQIDKNEKKLGMEKFYSYHNSGIFYVLTVVIYCHLLSECGYFVEEEEHA